MLTTVRVNKTDTQQVDFVTNYLCLPSESFILRYITLLSLAKLAIDVHHLMLTLLK